MSETVFAALLGIIIIPYSLIFLVLLWNELGPLIRPRLMRGARVD